MDRGPRPCTGGHGMRRFIVSCHASRHPVSLHNMDRRPHLCTHRSPRLSGRRATPPRKMRSPPHTLQETACRGTPIPFIGIQLPQDEDDQLMKCRWVRQAIHAELDSIREGFTATGESLPVDFEVAGDENFVD